LINEIYLDDQLIKITKYKEEIVNGLMKISISFNVTSEEYHSITTLLYKGVFKVKVPAREMAFKGRIQQYFTSITNLYVKEQVGKYRLSLLEVRD
jgi:hypothetical protein